MSSSDQIVTKEPRAPGYQPGRFRLILGKCQVGALALARNPRYARSVSKERGGLQSQIVDLNVNKHGRCRSRIRKACVRECHRKTISKDMDLNVATWNTQGLNWSRTEERHVSKLMCLVAEMRSNSVDLMCLTDLHGQQDDAISVDSRYTTCMVEEFILVQCGRVGFFLSPAAVKGWNGKAQGWGEFGRIATIDLLHLPKIQPVSTVGLQPLFHSARLDGSPFASVHIKVMCHWCS